MASEGTWIETPFGRKNVESLRKNDLVYTSGRIEHNKFHVYDARMAVPVRFVGQKKTSVNIESAPVCIPKDFFSEGVPFDDLFVSRNHGVVIDGELIPAYKLMDKYGLPQSCKARRVTYYHIELQEHSTVIANGVCTESYLDGGNRKSLKEVVRTKRIA
jgi:hypothetical protein